MMPQGRNGSVTVRAIQCGCGEALRDAWCKQNCPILQTWSRRSGLALGVQYCPPVCGQWTTHWDAVLTRFLMKARKRQSVWGGSLWKRVRRYYLV